MSCLHSSFAKLNRFFNGKPRPSPKPYNHVYLSTYQLIAMNNIANRIAEKIGHPALLNDLAEKLSASELNTLLLELFRTRAKKIAPAELLRQFEKNRFVQPSPVDPIHFLEFEMRCLWLAKSKGFKPTTLSPLAPLGTCSAIAFVDQNNVVTSLRGQRLYLMRRMCLRC